MSRDLDGRSRLILLDMSSERSVAV